MATVEGRTDYDLGMIFRKFGQEYERTHNMTSEQRTVMNALSQCRTAHLGGHLERCVGCGHERPSYNSCRNTNCPTCQGIERRRWVERRLDELLPVPYFHVTATLPSSFQPLIMRDPRPIYNLLMRCSAETLLELFETHDASLPLITSVLHTWGQKMNLHPHAHMLVTAGGMSMKGDGSWINHDGNYLFRVEDVSRRFRRRFIRELVAHQRQTRAYDDSEIMRACLRAGREWVVHCKKPFAGPATVVDYLSRYVYRTAISNRRILEVTDAEIRFEYRDYRKEKITGQVETGEITMDPMTFIAQYLQHILPRGTRRIRFYGVLGRKDKAERLEACWNLLGPAPVEEPRRERSEIEEEFGEDAEDPNACPGCGGMAFRACGVVPRRLPRPITFRNERVKRRSCAA